jgi:membrane-bound ClpP family serine protease
MEEVGEKKLETIPTAREPWITTAFLQAILCILGFYAMFFLPWVSVNINPFTISGNTLYDLVSFGNLIGFQVGSFLLFVGLGVCLFHRRTIAIGWFMVFVAMAVMSVSFLTSDLKEEYFGLGMYVEWAITLFLFVTIKTFRRPI